MSWAQRAVDALEPPLNVSHYVLQFNHRIGWNKLTGGFQWKLGSLSRVNDSHPLRAPIPRLTVRQHGNILSLRSTANLSTLKWEKTWLALVEIVANPRMSRCSKSADCSPDPSRSTPRRTRSVMSRRRGFPMRSLCRCCLAQRRCCRSTTADLTTLRWEPTPRRQVGQLRSTPTRFQGLSLRSLHSRSTQRTAPTRSSFSRAMP